MGVQVVRVQEHGAKFGGTFMLLFVELCSATLLSLRHYHKSDVASRVIILAVSVLYRCIIKEDMHQKQNYSFAEKLCLYRKGLYVIKAFILEEEVC